MLIAVSTLGYIFQAATCHGGQESGDARTAEERGRTADARGCGTAWRTREKSLTTMPYDAIEDLAKIRSELLPLYITHMHSLRPVQHSWRLAVRFSDDPGDGLGRPALFGDGTMMQRVRKSP